ncbi:hypothetical protein B0H19DRAFT_1072602 [Mycena capillaripes]|nr:hypothetical protein B0H19DRAFT_1072602 [Mycena capillaripes]
MLAQNQILGKRRPFDSGPSPALNADSLHFEGLSADLIEFWGMMLGSGRFAAEILRVLEESYTQRPFDSGPSHDIQLKEASRGKTLQLADRNRLYGKISDVHFLLCTIGKMSHKTRGNTLQTGVWVFKLPHMVPWRAGVTECDAPPVASKFVGVTGIEARPTQE